MKGRMMGIIFASACFLGSVFCFGVAFGKWYYGCL